MCMPENAEDRLQEVELALLWSLRSALSFCLEREQIAGDTDGDETQHDFHPAGGKQEEDAMQTGNPQ